MTLRAASLACVADPLHEAAAPADFDFRTCFAGLQVQSDDQPVHFVRARRALVPSGAVPIIQEGWAASIVVLSDGSRQIVSFLLPGDIVTAFLYGLDGRAFVEAITDLTYCAVDRDALHDRVWSQTSVMQEILRSTLAERRVADELIVDLGRRTAEERIARLILRLMKRLQDRGLIPADALEFAFPLRQHHIADATGLNSVHVNKVLAGFKRNGIIQLNDRALRILDADQLDRVANMR